MNKVVIKILQGSVVTQTMLGGLQLQISYSVLYSICQKLWKLVESRQGYCNANHVQFFGPPWMCQILWKSAGKISRLTFLASPRRCSLEIILSNGWGGRWAKNGKVILVLKVSVHLT